tara:strand:- start:615 stop:2174 length:1560 start_codon:yes stop_codon:yes gene_type:complete
MEMVVDRGHKLGQPASPTWEESVETAGSVYNALSKPLHVGLDMLSYFPPADLAHSALYAAEGSPGMAALYAGFSIPGLGDYGQAGHLIHKYATAPIRVPMGRLWTNVKMPVGYELPRIADLKGDTGSYFKGIKTALWDDKPLWLHRLDHDAFKLGDDLYAKELTKGKGGPIMKHIGTHNQAVNKSESLLNYKWSGDIEDIAARYHLNRAVWGLGDKAFKGTRQIYNPKAATTKRYENVKYNIKRGDIFREAKSVNPSDKKYKDLGKLWEFNTDTEIGKRLYKNWNALFTKPGYDRYHPIFGNFGVTTKDGLKRMTDPTGEWDFGIKRAYSRGPTVKQLGETGSKGYTKDMNLFHYIVSNDLYKHLKPLPMYDRMFDTWDFALNNPTWANIFSSPTSFARHYGSKLFGLSPVKVIQDVPETLTYSKLGEDIWLHHGIVGLFKPKYLKNLDPSNLKTRIRPQDLKSKARNIKQQMIQNPYPAVINNPFGKFKGTTGRRLNSKSKLKNFERKQWNHPNPFDK